MVGDRSRRVLGGCLGFLRGAVVAAVRARRELARDAGRRLVRRVARELRRAPAAPRARRGTGGARARPQFRAAAALVRVVERARRVGARRRDAAARARRAAGRPRRGVHAEHPRDGDRDARRDRDRRGLVVGGAGVRGAHRDRPLRADRTERAVRRRRLPFRRQGLRSHGRDSRDPGRPAVGSAPRVAAVSQPRFVARDPGRSRRGRPGCRNRSCTATSGRSSSTSRAPGSGRTSARPRACSSTRRPAG